MRDGRMIRFPYRQDLFRGFVEYKRSLGYAVDARYQYVLAEISRALAEGGGCPEVVGKAQADAMCARRDGEAAATQRHRVSTLRQFCVWLVSVGYGAYVPPPDASCRPEPFEPRIVGEEEFARALAHADEAGPPSVGAMMRVLWCCGLRLGEACSLTRDDLDASAGTLRVRHAKGDKERLVPMSRSLWEYVVELPWIEASPPDGPLLPTVTGKFWHRANARAKIQSAFSEAGILTSRGRPARPHDLRHSMAVHALDRMASGGTDLYVTLPLLAAYMGHSDIKSTEYYLRLTDSAKQSIVDAQAGVSSRVFGGPR